ncbi:MAG: tetratricopeptide repeat protein [Planctomycetes bacterium]|nr:tetratricopeptide repeat protein [Planctomycetota bacterium]
MGEAGIHPAAVTRRAARYDAKVNLEELQSAVASDPQSAELRAQLGDALLRHGRAEDALEHLRRALALEPARLEVYLLLGQALAAESDHIGAIATLEGGQALARRAGRADLLPQFEARLGELGPGKRSRAGMDEAGFRGTARAALASIAQHAAELEGVTQQTSPDVVVLEARKAKIGLSVQAAAKEIWCTWSGGELRFRYIVGTQRWRAGGGEELMASVAEFLSRNLGRPVAFQ